MRGTQMARQWKIIRLMETRRTGISGNDLATELDVPPRTVYRDLEALQEAGFPLYTEKRARIPSGRCLIHSERTFPSADYYRVDGSAHEPRRFEYL